MTLFIEKRSTPTTSWVTVEHEFSGKYQKERHLSKVTKSAISILWRRNIKKPLRLFETVLCFSATDSQLQENVIKSTI